MEPIGDRRDLSARAEGTERPLTTLILPAYNPGPDVERTWHEVRHFLLTTPDQWEVLFVCDGCMDGTPERLKHLTQDLRDRVRVLLHAPNRGKGFAVRRGLEEAAGAWRIFTDVDLPYGLEGVLRVAEKLKAGNDVVVASRLHPDSRLSLPYALQDYVYRRRLQSSLFSMLVRCVLPLGRRDTQAGLKGLSASAIQKILPYLRCDGFAFDCELLLTCDRHGLPIAEVPIHYHYHDRRTTTGLSTIGRMVRELWSIRRSWKQSQPVAQEVTVQSSRSQAA